MSATTTSPSLDALREIDAFMRAFAHVTLATVNPSGTPEAATIGVVITGAGDLVFDTLESTRKWLNLSVNPRVAVVIGWDDHRTLQLEGLATAIAPDDPERDALLEAYFARFPTGRERLAWPGLRHVRIRPTWLRYSDFRSGVPRLIELGGPPHLAAIR